MYMNVQYMYIIGDLGSAMIDFSKSPNFFGHRYNKRLNLDDL